VPPLQVQPRAGECQGSDSSAVAGWEMGEQCSHPKCITRQRRALFTQAGIRREVLQTFSSIFRRHWACSQWRPVSCSETRVVKSGKDTLTVIVASAFANALDRGDPSSHRKTRNNKKLQVLFLPVGSKSLQTEHQRLWDDSDIPVSIPQPSELRC